MLFRLIYVVYEQHNEKHICNTRKHSNTNLKYKPTHVAYIDFIKKNIMN